MVARCLDAIWVSGVVQHFMTPTGVLPSFLIMVWDVGGGLWWAVTAAGKETDLKGFARRPYAQPVSLERHGHRNNKNSNHQIYVQTREVDTKIINWALFIHLNEPSKTIANPNGSVVDAWLWIILSGRDFHPGPPCPPGHLPPQIEFAGVLRYT